MAIITEIFDSIPRNGPEFALRRDEALLIELPKHPLPNMHWAVGEPLPVYHFMSHYEEMKFAPPRGVFEGERMRVEWQNMNSRQPFYHRNTDADELSFQIAGERTLITEYGTVELRPGDFTWIPVGAAHDNYGRENVHMLFYLQGPVTLQIEPTQVGKYLMPPFDGWQVEKRIELITTCFGEAHCDVGVSCIDEQLLLDGTNDNQQRLQVTRANSEYGDTQWVFKTPDVWIGATRLKIGGERKYRRHRCADEIQYQVSGERTLVTQRGTVVLRPGDCVKIPFGCAFSSETRQDSLHLSVLTTESTAPSSEPVRYADMHK